MPCPLSDQGSSWEVEAGSAQGIETPGERALWLSRLAEVGFEISTGIKTSPGKWLYLIPVAEARNPNATVTKPNFTSPPLPSSHLPSHLRTLTALEELLAHAFALAALLAADLAPSDLALSAASRSGSQADRDPALCSSSLKVRLFSALSTACPHLIHLC
jgi:hypothetical protein